VAEKNDYFSAAIDVLYRGNLVNSVLPAPTVRIPTGQESQKLARGIKHLWKFETLDQSVNGRDRDALGRFGECYDVAIVVDGTTRTTDKHCGTPLQLDCLQSAFLSYLRRDGVSRPLAQLTVLAMSLQRH
jgi:hypothetical protein